LFNEIQELSEAKKLHATLEENNMYSQEAKSAVHKYAPSADYIVGFVTGALTLAVGLSVYQRISERL
jgi:adenine/guanine phosphoribosyltransferase-like PRPP-binding protein